MFLQNLRAKVGARLDGDGEAGFTLIELLVVMLILGILAAIALPAFFNQKDKAGDAKAKEYVHSAQVAMETYATDNDGSYADASIEKLKEIEPSLANAAFVTGTGKFVAAEDGYTITIEGAKSTQQFWIKNDGGTLTFECIAKGEGGCPSNGHWGGETVAATPPAEGGE